MQIGASQTGVNTKAFEVGGHKKLPALMEAITDSNTNREVRKSVLKLVKQNKDFKPFAKALKTEVKKAGIDYKDPGSIIANADKFQAIVNKVVSEFPGSEKFLSDIEAKVSEIIAPQAPATIKMANDDKPAKTPAPYTEASRNHAGSMLQAA